MTVLRRETGKFGFTDMYGARLQGTEKLTCELTVRNGKVVYDLNGISRPDWEKTAEGLSPDRRLPMGWRDARTNGWRANRLAASRARVRISVISWEPGVYFPYPVSSASILVEPLLQAKGFYSSARGSYGRENVDYIAGLVCLAIAPSYAQEVSAGITGRVTDPSGGAIVSASVTAKDLARGTEWPTKTNEEGIYFFPRVPDRAIR